MTDDTVRRIDALLAVGMRLARTAPSGRVALGQLAQVIDLAWVPQPWGREIVTELEAADLQAREPIPFDRVQRALRAAWDQAPERVLDELDPAPVRVGPSSQVHRATLAGRPVAVKVLRPGLPALVRQDLTLLETLAGPIAAAFPALDAGGLLREVRERTLDDLDLEAQALAQRRLHRALRGHPLLSVPAPVSELTHDTVLVSEWIPGTPLAAAGQPERDRACALLVIFALGAARWGTVHADLHPGEVLVLDDGGIAIVEVGAHRVVARDRIDAAATLVESFVTDDLAGFAAALEGLGWLASQRAGMALELLREALGPFAGAAPVHLDTAAVVAVRDRALARPELLLELLAAGRLEPEDLWAARGIGQLFAAIARVGATDPWRELVRAGLRDGWEAQPEP